jgi:hypothetical protein
MEKSGGRKSCATVPLVKKKIKGLGLHQSKNFSCKTKMIRSKWKQNKHDMKPIHIGKITRVNGSEYFKANRSKYWFFCFVFKQIEPFRTEYFI